MSKAGARVPTHWVGGRLVDAGAGLYVSPWARIVGVVILLLVFDLALAMIPA